MTTERQRAVAGSTVVRLARTVSIQLGTWYDTARETLADGADGSAFERRLRALARWTRNAYLYRWLTTESECDALVVDLRKTYTVGPVVERFDRLRPTVETTWRASVTRAVTTELRRTVSWFENSLAVRLLVAALKPPEPPKDR